MVVVVLLPRGERLLGLGEIDKPMHREALSPQRAIEGCADAVVDRFAWPGKVETCVVPIRPLIEGGGGGLVVPADAGTVARPLPADTHAAAGASQLLYAFVLLTDLCRSSRV